MKRRAPPMSRGLALKTLAEWARRAGRRERLDLRKLTFAPQCAFVTDPAPYVAASCSRQAGKTWAIGLKLIDRALEYPGKTCLYITNTRPQARAIIWPVLHELNELYGLGGKFHEVRLSFTLPNGAVIQLGGANDAVEIERYRGPQYPLVVIDEAQSIRPFIRQLIFEIIRPGQAKYADRQILITGTPNAARAGFLYDVVTGDEEGWSVHHWTIRDNIHIPDVEEFLAEECRVRHLTPQDAAFRREYGGEWVRDAASQVYQVRSRNLIDTFPDDPKDWRYVIGIDFGFVNVTAFAVLGYSVRAGRVVVAESFQTRPPEGEDLLTPEFVAAKLAGLQERYDVASIVGDPGGLGAKFILQLRRRFAIPIVAAEKQQKLGAIELLNGDLRTKTVQIVEDANEDLLHDAANLQWNWTAVDEKKHGGNVLRSDLMIDDRTPDHLTDAFTYAYRQCRHFLYDDEEEGQHPPIGSPEYEVWLEEQRVEEQLAETEEDDWLEGELPEEDPLGLSGFGL